MKEMFVERHEDLLRIVIRNDGVIEEYFMEEDSCVPCYGEIYLGIVKNVVPSIGCAFIDIGYEKNAYIYVDEKFNNGNLKKGDSIIVQIVKEGSYDKGPRVTGDISIPGVYSALITSNTMVNFSKKITDRDFKEYIIHNIKKPKDTGVMLRTAAGNAKIEDINNEMKKLYILYNDVIMKANYNTKSGILFNNGGIIGKILRDRVSFYNLSVYLNDEKDYISIKNFLEDSLYNEMESKIFIGKPNLFEHYGIENELLKLLNDRIYLKCGGYIVINKTEAMYVIDVNSGKNIKNYTKERTAYNTNYEAAEEIARQIRLRNLSGIIVVDFIDMKDELNKCKVIDKLKNGFCDDKNKTAVYPFTELNLVQIARKRVNRSLYEYIYENCDVCSGKGKRLKFSYLCMLIRNKIEERVCGNNIKNIHITLNTIYERSVESNMLQFIRNINALCLNIYLTYDSKLYYKVEPLIFSSQINALSDFNVYTSNHRI